MAASALPRELSPRVRVPAVERVRQRDPARPVCEIDTMPLATLLHFQQPKPAESEQRRDEPLRALKLGQPLPDFVAREGDRHARATPGADQAMQPVELQAEDAGVEEEERAEHLVLRRGGDVPMHRRRREERHDFLATDLLRPRIQRSKGEKGPSCPSCPFNIDKV